VLAGQDVDVDVGYGLSGVLAVLDGQVCGVLRVEAEDEVVDVPRGAPEVGGFVVGEVAEGRRDAAGNDEDVAWDKGFQVHDGEAGFGGEEDLPVVEGDVAEGDRRRGESGGGPSFFFCLL